MYINLIFNTQFSIFRTLGPIDKLLFSRRPSARLEKRKVNKIAYKINLELSWYVLSVAILLQGGVYEQ